MRPELFTIPLVNLSIKSYGFMMVLGFLAALWLARRHCRRTGLALIHVTNFGTYALLAGVAGARLMHVFHNWHHYKDHLGEIIAVWSGGLEFLGGVAVAIVVMIVYFRKHKLPLQEYLDVFTPALMLGLAFGRLGCLLNGCCFGAPADLPWAMRFPALNQHTQAHFGCEKHTRQQYSFPFDYQIHPDPVRRPGKAPLLQLPDDFYFGYADGRGNYLGPAARPRPAGNWFGSSRPPEASISAKTVAMISSASTSSSE